MSVDNIYIRLQQLSVSQVKVALTAFRDTSAWFSNTTLQGDQGRQTAMEANDNAALYFSGALYCWTPQHGVTSLCGHVAACTWQERLARLNLHSPRERGVATLSIHTMSLHANDASRT